MNRGSLRRARAGSRRVSVTDLEKSLRGPLSLRQALARIPRVQVYALASSEPLHETLDLFRTRAAAEAELRQILQDEPDWKDVLRIVGAPFGNAGLESDSAAARRAMMFI
jgi:hypothetical protein